ncbi:MAG: septal ring lytic transglycosylase RlpA family protein [Rickettsiales bacterium]|jgi:rare lipoprotein A|nr:septal ring lytic transglycosylase RlpA family protein [Rickettsiales bacterium]
MKKNLWFIALFVLAACAEYRGSEVPIRSATKPAPAAAEPSYNDMQSYDDNFAQPTEDEFSSVPQAAEPVESAPTQAPVPAAPAAPAAPLASGGTYKIGNPYLIDGVPYYPHENYEYSEVGIASWYGPDFHGKSTSNGEVFDTTKYTAAHRTLPLPSLVRVTNLENGASLTIKINDRGPFARDRIIDLSSAAADVLGVKQKGSARVKVEILPEQSRNLKELALAGGNTDIYSPDITLARTESAVPDPAAAEVRPLPASDGGVVEMQPNYTRESHVGHDNFTATPVAPVPAPTPVIEEVAAVVAPASAARRSPEEGEYFVQVAAYSSYEKAEAMKNKLVGVAPVKIFKAVQNGNTLYKVRLGEFPSKTEAERVQKAIGAKGIDGSRVILKDGNELKWNVN